jgi:DNA-binding IclR family transcriptional regulator
VKDYGPIAVEQYPALGPAALSLHNWAGRRIPLHATLDGKVLLAYLPEAGLTAIAAPGPERRGHSDRLGQRLGPELPHPGHPHPRPGRRGHPRRG